MSEPKLPVPIELISDEPATEFEALDLDMERWAQIVAGAAVGTKGPFTIGLYAPWGQGKTSLLNRATFLASLHPGVHAFLVNPWRHEHEEDPFSKLIRDMLLEIDHRLEDPKYGKNIRKLQGLKKVLAISALAAPLVSMFAGAPMHTSDGGAHHAQLVPNFPAIDDLTHDQMLQIGKDFKEVGIASAGMAGALAADTSVGPPIDSSSPQSRLIQAMEQFAPNQKAVVFIDDLDRCHPDTAVKLLESIKHVLWVPGFVFVLALDERVIVQYLQHRYQEEFGVKSDADVGRRYLQKLVQTEIRIPIAQRRSADYIKQLLNKVSGGSDWIPHAELLSCAAHQNPRQTKRLLNNLLMDAAVWKAMRGRLTVNDASAFAVSRALEAILQPDQFAKLRRKQEVCDALLERIDQQTPSLKLEQRYVNLVANVYEAIEEAGMVESLQKRRSRVWFTDSETRQRVVEFLSPGQRDDDPEEMVQKQIVESAIRSSLSMDALQPVTADDYSRVSILQLTGSLINDEGLVYVAKCGNLERLYLDECNNIQSLAPLQGLERLKELQLGGSSVRDAKAVSELNSLEILGCNHTQIESPPVLGSLKNLVSLSLAESHGIPVLLKDLSKTLQHLNVDSHKVDTSGDISHLTALTSLQVRRCIETESDLKFLSHLAGLTQLVLGGMDDLNLEQLAENCRSLQYLTAESIMSVSGSLSSFKQLERATFVYCGMLDSFSGDACMIGSL